MVAVVAALGCGRVEVGGLPATETAEPLVRVGLVLNGSTVTVGGGEPLLVSGREASGLTAIPQGIEAAVVTDAAGVEARFGSTATPPVAELTVRPAADAGLVRLNGRDYRGSLVLSPAPTGLLAVNLVSLEEYVAGVVSAEMGRRPADDLQALYAQAVVSRSLAVRALGRYRVRGYDLLGTVADQAYGGVGSETALGWEAVRATRGQVLTYDGAVIETFFHSTCAGRTEAVEAAFSGGPEPYLRSVSDRDPSGRPYCALSPRFRWREEWTGEALARSLAANATGVGLDRRSVVVPSDLEVVSRTPSGRVAELALVAGGRSVPIVGQNAIRQALRLPDGSILRSAQFTLQVTRAGGRIVRVVAEGGGNGHGVGMCQWGAVGRARAGFSYVEILNAYFPGTEIRRLY